MTECGCKTEEEVKAMQSEIKKNIQGTNSEGKETGTQINNLEQKEEINIQAEDGIRDHLLGLVGSEMCIRDRYSTVSVSILITSFLNWACERLAISLSLLSLIHI